MFMVELQPPEVADPLPTRHSSACAHQCPKRLKQKGDTTGGQQIQGPIHMSLVILKLWLLSKKSV